MKILMVTPYFHPRRGGVEHYSYAVAQGLVKRGHDVRVLCHDREERKESIDGIQITRVRPDFILSSTPIRLGLALDISKNIKGWGPDLINAHTPVIYSADIVAMVAKKYRVPFVLTFHNDNFKDHLLLNVVVQVYNYSLQLITLRLSDKLIVASPFSYHESPFIARFKKKAVWIPPGVESRAYVPNNDAHYLTQKYGLSPGAKIVLFVGQISSAHRHKGVDVLLRAFTRVLKEVPDSYLILVGGGDRVRFFQSFSEELAISGNTIFTGSVDEAELVQLYQGANLVVLPSTTIQEGFGMTLIEGSACGKPVIGSAIGGMKYLVQNQVDGFTVPPKDENALADGIIKVLCNEEMAKDMGIAGREKAEQYDWEIITDKTEAVFREVAGV